MRPLKSAVEEACLAELDDLPDEVELAGQMPCSEDFEQRMEQLFHPQNTPDTPPLKHPRITRRLLLTAILTALLASTVSVQALSGLPHELVAADTEPPSCTQKEAHTPQYVVSISNSVCGNENKNCSHNVVGASDLRYQYRDRVTVSCPMCNCVVKEYVEDPIWGPWTCQKPQKHRLK